MDETSVKTNSLQAWILASRPKTLSGAAVPVMLGGALALKDVGVEQFQLLPLLLCFLFAFIMQIDSNFINDYFDYLKGNDDSSTRLGPKRACAEGWITLSSMRKGVIFMTLLGCLIGLPLICFGGFKLIIIGVLCVLFAFLYTTKLSYLGLGDLLVLIFFGLIPVCLTYYVILPMEAKTIKVETMLASIACGLVIDTLLLVNNYRDRDNDYCNGKFTLVVRLGEKVSEKLYLFAGIIASIIMALIEFRMITSIISLSQILLFFTTINLASIVYLIIHIKTWSKMKSIHKGKALNRILGLTGRNMFVFGLLHAFTIIFITIL